MVATKIEVQEYAHKGNNWEAISGAAWDVELRAGESVADAVNRDIKGGEYSADCPTRLVAIDEDGESYEFDFTPAELKLLGAKLV